MKAFLNWSGGKDSALCLYTAQKEGIPVQALLTTIANGRISMHGVPRNLLEQQAASLGLPLYTMEMPEQPGMQVYEDTLSALHHKLKSEGYTHSVYGDIFLEDLKQFRDRLLQKDGLTGLYPLWGADSRDILRQFWSAGFKAIVVCTNSHYLDQSFCGRLLDESLIRDLPEGVDPCGENGEFHSFVFDGPLFSYPLSFQKGDIIYKEYPAPKQEGDDCFTTPQPPAGFYFQTLEGD
jgi:uncharacterized protein (TIGR00290 family)